MVAWASFHGGARLVSLILWTVEDKVACTFSTETRDVLMYPRPCMPPSQCVRVRLRVRVLGTRRDGDRTHRETSRGHTETGKYWEHNRDWKRIGMGT